MAKKKTKKSVKDKKQKKNKNKNKNKAEPTKPKKILKKEEKASLPSRQARSLESREIWKKNGVLALILFIVIALNVWLYFKGRNPVESDQKSVVVEKQEQENYKAIEPEIDNDNRASEDQSGGLNEEEKKVIQALLDEKELESWKTYKNAAYAFMLKYPEDWPEPVAVKSENGQKYKFKVSFRNIFEEGDESKGFDVYVYRAQKSKNFVRPDYTDNLVEKDTIAEDYSNCGEIGTVYLSENQYPAMEMYYLKDDPCFFETYFLVLEKGSYLYDIVPVPQGGVGYSGYDGKQRVAETMPEFDKIANTFNFIQVTAKKTTVVRRITAPRPLAETRKVGGKMMCAKKNDKPRKSKTNKKKHMDMECCLDPDEYPNPWCAY